MSIHFKQNGRLHIINRLQIREPANKVHSIEFYSRRQNTFDGVAHFDKIIAETEK
jgi:hypothetical protein